MKAYKCDRCDNFFEGIATTANIRYNEMIPEYTMDLCENCITDFERIIKLFIKNKRIMGV